MNVRIRVTVAFSYTLLLFLFAVLVPSSHFISLPFAWLFFLMLKLLVPGVLLGTDGASIFVPSSGSVLEVTDVCSLVPLIGLVAVFLWVRGVGWRWSVAVIVLFFVLNLVRILGVGLVLASSGWSTAARVHDIAYASFTVASIGVVAYCCLPWWLDASLGDGRDENEQRH